MMGRPDREGETAPLPLPPTPEDITFLYATLTREPFNLLVSEIRSLTDRQIYDIYLHKQNEDGSLRKMNLLPDSFTSDDQKRMVFFSMGEAMGIPLEVLEDKWMNRNG